MKKTLLTIGLALSASLSALAQQPAATTPAASQADTVQAVRQMFSKRRTGGWIWTAIGAAAAVRVVTASVSEGDGNAGGTALGAVVLGGVPAAIGVGKLARFSMEKEDAVLGAYGPGKPLPKYVRRRLKSKYFEE